MWNFRIKVSECVSQSLSRHFKLTKNAITDKNISFHISNLKTFETRRAFKIEPKFRPCQNSCRSKISPDGKYYAEFWAFCRNLGKNWHRFTLPQNTPHRLWAHNFPNARVISTASVDGWSSFNRTDISKMCGWSMNNTNCSFSSEDARGDRVDWVRICVRFLSQQECMFWNQEHCERLFNWNILTRNRHVSKLSKNNLWHECVIYCKLLFLKQITV